MQVKVSVVIPIYNAEKYLEQCIDSIVHQTLKEIEIILINDGSKDHSGEICKKYLNDPRVIYYEKENEGLAAARQDGMDRAGGEYIGFIDSDDWAEPDMYEKMYQAACVNSADVVLCNCFEYDEPKNRIDLAAGAYDKKRILEEILPKSLIRIDENGNRRNIRWANWIRIYKRETILRNDIRFDRRFRRCQDLPFTFEAMLYAKNFYYLDAFLYHNRQDAGSLSRGYTKKMWKLLQPLIMKIYQLAQNYFETDLNALADTTGFFLTMDCILNEFKDDAPGFFQKVRHIREILSADMTKDMLARIDGKKLNGLYRKVYFKNMKDGKAAKLVTDHWFYGSKLKRRLSPLVGKITDTKLYRKLRKGRS